MESERAAAENADEGLGGWADSRPPPLKRWGTQRELSDRANDLVKHRQSTVVPIESADAAFTELEAKVDALEAQRLAKPLSPRLAVATMKRLLSEEKYRIQLEDFVVAELNAVRKQTDLSAFPLGSPEPNKDAFCTRVEQMEVACSKLVPMVATGVYWGDKRLDSLWRRCAEHLARSEFQAGTSYYAWSYLQYYPAALVVYGAGIAAILRRRFDLLELLLMDSHASQPSREGEPMVSAVASTVCFHFDAAQWLHDVAPQTKRRTPGSDWMVERLKPMVLDVIGQDVVFEDIFDELEFIMALISVDIGVPPLMGRFGWRGGLGQPPRRVIRLANELKENAADHPLLAAGLFEANADRLTLALTAVTEAMQRERF